MTNSIARLSFARIAGFLAAPPGGDALRHSRILLASPFGVRARLDAFHVSIQHSPLASFTHSAQRLLLDARTFQDRLSTSEAHTIDQHLRDYRAALEAGVDALTTEVQQARRQQLAVMRAQADVNALLDHTFTHLVTMRALLDEHARLAQQSNAPPSVAWVHIPSIVDETIEQVKAFCVEKNGACPEIVFATPPPTDEQHTHSLLGRAADVHFILVELLKNSCTAVLNRYGVLKAYQAPPITVNVGADRDELVLRVSDQGACNCRWYFRFFFLLLRKYYLS